MVFRLIATCTYTPNPQHYRDPSPRAMALVDLANADEYFVFDALPDDDVTYAIEIVHDNGLIEEVKP